MQTYLAGEWIDREPYVEVRSPYSGDLSTRCRVLARGR